LPGRVDAANPPAVADVGLLRPQGVPVGGLGEPSGVDADGFLVDAEELLDRPLGLLVVALAEVVEADSAGRDRRGRRPASSGSRATDVDEDDAPAQLLGRERFGVEPDRRAVERREVAVGGLCGGHRVLLAANPAGRRTALLRVRHELS
jgi:hypothetical protein